ncbi:hypothetical protein CRV08_06805 [Halarcobacter ebronensis]|uniref:MOSC domain-containing protein n=1 Tax=Halarcobacter ebronensis TaxID=1462615 RepID=A0A4Q0YDJ6_9BACT|nr:MOSC domain-containing protein [Halarcobacter ebronensis]RXJ68532.1 hypothetical protein CRV08_06805 [Halarcobacter ebronensis]
MKLKSIAIGEPKSYFRGEKEFESAYKKDIFLKKVRVTKLGLEGDFQVDKRFHGGEDKAIHFGSTLHLDKNPSFDKLFVGCNIFVDEIDEDSIYVGDVYKVGECLVEVTQPRQPCWKIGALFGKEPNRYIVRENATGWYVRVLKEGVINEEDKMVLEKRVSTFSIKELSLYLKNLPKDEELISTILNTKALAETYKNDFKKAIML